MQGERVAHGAFDYSELERLGVKPEEILDFSVNSNPYGPSPVVRDALATLALERYPDRDCLELKRALLCYEMAGVKIGPEALVCGNGASELIWTIARAFLRPGAVAAQLAPTFGEYQAASQIAGAHVVTFQLQPESGFHVDLDAVLDWLERERPALLWLCNPNNPTGGWLTPTQLRRLLDACVRLGTLLVVDESYYHFLFPLERDEGSALALLRERERVIVLRSLTKDFALAALRIGYAATTPELAAQLSAHLPSWNVNGAAQVAATAALTDRAHLEWSLRALERERETFFAALRELGLSMVPTRTHYGLVRVGRATALREVLLHRGLLVRDCSSFGLPQFIRVATRQRHEWERLTRELAALRRERSELWSD